MRKIFYLLLTTLVVASCGESAPKKNVEHAVADTLQANHIEVLYFHGAQRCVTCRAIETHTSALLDSLYAKELADGLIQYKVIDISQPEHEAIAKRYEVTWSALLVNSWDEGTECINDLTKCGFSYARHEPQRFKQELQNTIDELLKQL